jgi:hypothetical protein
MHANKSVPKSKDHLDHMVRKIHIFLKRKSLVSSFNNLKAAFDADNFSKIFKFF